MKNIISTRVTLGDKAFSAIRHAILSLELEPGQMISEINIATQLGVSRTPVREAFNRLKQEELLEIYPQKCVVVSRISIKKLNDIRFVRESLEISSFKKIAKHFDIRKPEYAELNLKVQNVLAQAKEAYSAQDLALFFKMDNQFHSQFLEFLKNKTLVDTIKRINCHIDRVRFLELKETQNMPDVLREHNDIFMAVKNNDQALVDKLLQEHFTKFHRDEALVKKYPKYFCP